MSDASVFKMVGVALIITGVLIYLYKEDNGVNTIRIFHFEFKFSAPALVFFLGGVVLLIFPSSAYYKEEPESKAPSQNSPPLAVPSAVPTDASNDVSSDVPPPDSTPTPAAKVSIIATDEVWVRIYDAHGKTLYQNTLKAGDRYDVPADAENPMINVGRPDKLQILVNGTPVPPLGDGARAILDVGISAAALAARAAQVPDVTQPSAQ